MRPRHLIPLLCATLATTPAHAGDVVFSTGLLGNSCVLNVSTPGVLGAAVDGSTLSSEAGTGTPAVMSVVAVGGAPTLNFSAPTLTAPAGWSGTATTAIRYQSTSGANHAYGTTASSMTGGTLIDTVTINARVQAAGGFATGTYAVRTTVTCQQ